MSKKIVVFGPDNSGKTTLVQNIHDALPYFNKSHSLGPVSVEEMLKYTEDNLNSQDDFIFDRFPMIEEATCGYVLRGLNKFENMIDKVLDDVMLQVNKVNAETSEYVRRMLAVMEYDIPYTSRDIMALLGLKSKDTLRKNYLNPAMGLGLVKMTIPDKPNSRNQRYVKQ